MVDSNLDRLTCKDRPGERPPEKAVIYGGKIITLDCMSYHRISYHFVYKAWLGCCKPRFDGQGLGAPEVELWWLALQQRLQVCRDHSMTAIVEFEVKSAGIGSAV